MSSEMSERRPSLAVRLDAVIYQVRDKRVLDGVDLAVREQEILAVMGRSGSGKTTILRLIMGLVQPTAGEIWVGDREIGRLSEPELLQVREQMGLVFQNAALFDSLNVGENVAFGLVERGELEEEAIEGKARQALFLVGMAGTEALMPAELSGGMRKRVGVARALVMEPRIMLYDEPTAGLDPPTAASLNELIVSLRDNLGVTTVVVSHDVPALAQVADRAAMLEQGKIVAAGTLHELAESDRREIRDFFLFWREGEKGR